MQTIFLDGDLYPTPEALHLALQRMLGLPIYYGKNADALYDCLTQRPTPVNVYLLSPGKGDTAVALALCLQVFEDVGGEVLNSMHCK